MTWRKLAFLTETEDALADHEANAVHTQPQPPQVHDNTYHDPNFATAREGAKNIWVQDTEPTAIDIGDLWVET